VGLHFRSAYEEKQQKPADRLKAEFAAENSRSAQTILLQIQCLPPGFLFF